ncbi:sensor histidine kinase [Promicromonospora thailandica]|uniref:histidine kinase n=1 Tax=Promicromonospora thailandica TaxID=765201 RepID=A0A9X2JXF7_9MICO|nr:histidine kinase [Promicromonospora thailandica]MCP2266507.1 Histidine kinase [Promicromonospora thailandica]BFF17427.1 sensor histidine kinase [Promicromonospora thailandica]
MSTSTGEGRLSDVAVALGCWVGATALLVGVGHAVALDDAGDVVTPGFGQGAWWWTLGALTLQAALLLCGRRFPRATLVAVATVVPVLAFLGAGDATSFGALAVIIAAYAVTVRSGAVEAAPALLSAVALVGLGSTLGALFTGAQAGLAWGTGLLQAVSVVGVPAVVAVFVLARREARAAQADRLAALGREHEALVQVALSRERMAMARELHDIAAHHLTGIAVMTGVLERQIDVAPDDAKAAVRQVRSQSTAMLREMRGLVGLLRDPGAGPEERTRGVETLSGIPALVDAAAEAGTDAHLRVHGTLDTSVAVGPLAQLAAYRTVQECLSNAARHAPGARCDVEVDLRDPAHVVVTVRNGAPRRAPSAHGSGGFGLVGMRERAELTDARLTYGPTDDGGWLVTLTIPTEADTVSARRNGTTNDEEPTR